MSRIAPIIAILFSFVASTGPARAAAPPLTSGPTRVALPREAPAAWWDEVSPRIHDSQYEAARRDGALVAANPSQGFATRFDVDGFRITPTGEAEGWSWGLKLSGWGRPHELQAAAPSEPTAEGPRVERRRGHLTEWYVNGPEGLEHGFDVPARPEGAGPLVFDLRLEGTLRPVWSDDGQAVDFFAAAGMSVLRYAKLHVTDDRDAILPSRFRPIPGGIRIEVEDDGASYPIVVDPLAGVALWGGPATRTARCTACRSPRPAT